MAIRISHKTGGCGGLCGWWIDQPVPGEISLASHNYVGPSGLRPDPTEEIEIYCNRCGCRVGIADMAWPGKYELPDYGRILNNQFDRNYSSSKDGDNDNDLPFLWNRDTLLIGER